MSSFWFRHSDTPSSFFHPPFTQQTDLDYDGHLDALVTCKDVGDTLALYSVVYNRTAEGSVVAVTVTRVAEGFDDQVLLLDWDGDYRVDVLGTRHGTTVVLLNNGNATFRDASPMPALPSLAVPNSNAFVDLDGDCHADLVLTEAPAANGTARASLWLYRNGTYVRHAALTLPPGAGQLAFADFNRDGSIDVVFPVCWPADDCSRTNALVFVDNVQLPLCGGVVAGSRCRRMTDMCVADPEFFFADAAAPATAPHVTVVGRAAFDAAGVRLYAAPAERRGTHPLSVSVGDYNLDGYPDLLVTVVNATRPHVPFVQLWESVLCNETTCPELHITERNRSAVKQRTFVLQTQGVAELSRIPGVYAAAFLDFGESGALGVVALADPALTGTGGHGPRQVHGLFNNFRLDALFVKALGLNGICTAQCPTGPKYPSPKPYGVNYPGGSFKFALTDTDGTNLGAAGAQLYRTAYQSLQTPYVMFGLGRISNYIQTVFYGTAAAKPARAHNYWQGIIPNSYIFAIPYPPASPAAWTTELFLAPSSVVFFVILVVVLSLISLGILIIVFKSREMVCFLPLLHRVYFVACFFTLSLLLLWTERGQKEERGSPSRL